MDGATLGTAYIQVVPSTEGIAGELSSALGSAGDSAGVVSGKSFGSSFGSALGTAAKVGLGAVTAVGTGVVALGTSFSKSAGEVATYGDDIDKMSQKIGISAEAYQEWDAVLQHSGTSMSAMKPSMKTLFTQAQKGSEAFQELGISQEEAANMSKEDLFATTITALQNVSDENEKVRLAQELLGKGAVEMGALLNTSSADTQAMRDRVHELGGVMSNEAVKASAKYHDSLQDMTTSINGIKRNIVAEFLPAMSGVMDGITDIFSGDTDAGLEKISDGISDLISNMTTMMPAIMEKAGAIVKGIGQAIIQNLPQIVQMGAQIVLQLINGLVTALPDIMNAGIQAIATLAQSIGEALPTLIPAMVEAVMTMVEGLIDNIDLLINAALQLMIGLATGLIQAIPKIVEKIPTIIEKLVSAIVSAVPQIAAAGVKLLVALVTNLPQIITGIVSAIPKIISGIVNGFKDGYAKMKEVGKKLFESLGTALAGGASAIKEKAGKLLTAVKDAFKNAVENMKTIGTNIVSGLKNGISGAISKVSEIAKKVFEAIKNMFKNAPEALTNIGKNLMIGLYNGIVEKAKAVIEKVKSIAGDIIGFAKKILGISSPSKEFQKIGGYLMQGFANGISDAENDAIHAVMAASDDVTRAFTPKLVADNIYGSTGQMYRGSEQQVKESSRTQYQSNRNLTVIMELDRMQLGRAVYQLNNEETQRVGVRLAGGYA